MSWIFCSIVVQCHVIVYAGFWLTFPNAPHPGLRVPHAPFSRHWQPDKRNRTQRLLTCARVGWGTTQRREWMDSWWVTQQILYDFRNKFLTSSRRAANPPKVLYLRSLMHPPYTLSLWWPSYRKFSQLSYEPGCSHELWCRKCATWLWNKYVLFFLKLYSMHISKDILPLRSLNAIKKM